MSTFSRPTRPRKKIPSSRALSIWRAIRPRSIPRRSSITAGRVFGAVALFALGFVTALIWRSQPAETPSPPAARAQGKTRTPRAAPARPAPHADVPVREAEIAVVPDPSLGPKEGRLAIVIDDLGNNDRAALARLLAISGPWDGAVLPGLANSRATAGALRNAGKEVLLHLPLEPVERDLDPGPGAIRTGMDQSQTREMLQRDLADAPGAVGVNNHMGSRATADESLMTSVLSDVKARGLFFLDSRTSAATVIPRVARRLGVAVASRNVFLDDVEKPGAISKQLDQAIAAARSPEGAVAIGHPHPVTLDVLAHRLPALSSERVRLVFVSDLVRKN